MDDTFVVLCVVAPIAVIIAFFVRAELRRRRIAEAEEIYNEWLQELRAFPTDSAVRIQTLEAGREYARALRESGNETIFDEVALLNDINAIAGSSVSKSIERQQPSAPRKVEPEVEQPKSHEDRLRALADLRSKGLITEDEYNERRTKILDEI